jgi:Flp pilus assembly protein TadG
LEFGLVLPAFLLIIAAIMEFGLAFRIQHSLSSAARRGARAAIVDGTTSSEITERVQTHCTRTLGVDATDVAVNIAVNGDSGVDLSQASTEDEIDVNVSVPFAAAGVGIFTRIFWGSTLSATCVFEHE